MAPTPANGHPTTCMGGAGHGLRRCLIRNMWLAAGVPVQVASVGAHFVAVHIAFASGGRAMTAPADPGNIFPWATSDNQRPWLPCKMMVGMRPMSVVCAVKHTR